MNKSHLVLAAVTLLGLVLRFYQLGYNPPGLNLDEVAIGYNAFSILKTGKDEYGTSFPIAFRSHDDYKASLYIYLTVISVTFFGLNEFAVRFVSAFLGSVTVPLTYLLLSEFVGAQSKYRLVPLIGAILLAISPWHLQFSRVAFETNVAVFWIVLGLWAYFKAKRQAHYWIITVIAFALSLYTYHSNKLFIPLFSLVLIWNSRRQIKKHLKLAILASVVFTLITAPLIPFMLSPEGMLRFKGTSVYEIPNLVDLNHDQKLDQWRKGREYQAKTFHSEALAAILVALRGYFSHFNYEFLFHGESGPPKNYTPNVGLLYIWELPFIIIGVYSLFRNKVANKEIIITWLLFAPMAAAVTWDVPSSTRTTIILPTFQILTAFGVAFIAHELNRYRLIAFSGGIAVISVFSLGHYLDNYYYIAPQMHSDAWQYGYKQAVLATNKYLNQVDRVVVSTHLKQPHNFFAFYTAYDPQTYIEIDGGTRGGSFDESRNKFGKYEFHKIEWDEKSLQHGTLYVDLITIPDKRFKPTQVISLLNGQPNIGLYLY